MSFLGTLLIFTLWSCVVFLFAILAHRSKWLISTRPEFWLICLLICFAPFLPLPTFIQTNPLPDVLQFGSINIGVVQDVKTNVLEGIRLELNTFENWFLAVLAVLCFNGLCRFGLGLIKTYKIVQKSDHIELTNLFTEKQISELNKYKVKVLLTEDNISPFSFGLLNAYLILPRFIFKQPKEQIKLLIDHEISHISCNDHRWLIVVKLIVQLFSFNPIFKLFEIHYINAIELRCDKDVLNQNSDINERKSYALAMLMCLKYCVGVKDLTLVAHFINPQTGLSFYRTRLKAIMGQGSSLAKGKQLLLTATCMILMSIIVSFSLTNYVMAFSHDSKNWLRPLKNMNITSPFGVLKPNRNNSAHGGIDLKATIGTEIYAVRDGVVTIADSSSLHKNYGKTVVIDHQDGYFSLYAHLDGFEVSKNDKILAGQKIAFTGNTGKTIGPHLHFEIFKNEARIDPMSLLSFHRNRKRSDYINQ